MDADDDIDVILATRLRELPGHEPALSAGDVLGLARARAVRRARTRRRTAVAAALAAIALAAVGLGSVIAPRDRDVRTRGGTPPPPVRVEGLAEGPDGLRPIRDGDSLSSGEGLVVRVLAGGAGLLSVDADGERLWPSGRDEAIEAGAHWLGGASPLTWTPDAGPTGSHVVVVRLCAPDDPEHCGTASLRVRWVP